MNGEELKRLKDLKAENQRLKQMYSELALDNELAKDIIAKKALKPCQKKKLAEESCGKYGISRAYRVLDISRSSFYRTSTKNDSEIAAALQEKAEIHPLEGFWKAYHRLRREGHRWNHKRVPRIYVECGLNIRRKGKKRLPERIQQPLEVTNHLNHTWSMDFMQNRLTNGRKVRLF